MAPWYLVACCLVAGEDRYICRRIDPDDPDLIERLARAGYAAGSLRSGALIQWDILAYRTTESYRAFVRAVLAELRQAGDETR